MGGYSEAEEYGNSRIRKVADGIWSEKNEVFIEYET